MEKVEIRSPKIAPSVGRIRVVQISDVHVGLMVREKRVESILQAVKGAQPDLLVSTGDLVDGQVGELIGLVEMFRAVNPRYGKLAVTGNHEFYAGEGQAVAFTEKGGFRLLRGEGVTVAGVLNVAGVDDPVGLGMGAKREAQALPKSLPPGNFTLLLKHRPSVDPSQVAVVDMQLSGHVHGGQIFPFGFATRLFFPAGTGLIPLGESRHLYVSRGSGTWGPPIRFLAPPEVTVIDVLPAS